MPVCAFFGLEIPGEVSRIGMPPSSCRREAASFLLSRLRFSLFCFDVSGARGFGFVLVTFDFCFCFCFCFCFGFGFGFVLAAFGSDVCFPPVPGSEVEVWVLCAGLTSVPVVTHSPCSRLRLFFLCGVFDSLRLFAVQGSINCIGSEKYNPIFCLYNEYTRDKFRSFPIARSSSSVHGIMSGDSNKMRASLRFRVCTSRSIVIAVTKTIKTCGPHTSTIAAFNPQGFFVVFVTTTTVGLVFDSSIVSTCFDILKI